MKVAYLKKITEKKSAPAWPLTRITALLMLLSMPLYAEESTTLPAPAVPSSSTSPSAALDCHYQLPVDKKDIDTNLIKQWARNATIQSFDLNSVALEQQMEELKACYTDQGWQGFFKALEQSGNLQAIKEQQLTVSSQVDGIVDIQSPKENQWKVTIPLQVVYQNDKQKLTQELTIDVLVGRKVSGDLGIMQIIATPRKSAQAAPNEDTTKPAETSAASTAVQEKVKDDTPSTSESSKQ